MAQAIPSYAEQDLTTLWNEGSVAGRRQDVIGVTQAPITRPEARRYVVPQSQVYRYPSHPAHSTLENWSYAPVPLELAEQIREKQKAVVGGYGRRRLTPYPNKLSMFEKVHEWLLANCSANVREEVEG